MEVDLIDLGDLYYWYSQNVTPNNGSTLLNQEEYSRSMYEYLKEYNSSDVTYIVCNKGAIWTSNLKKG